MVWSMTGVVEIGGDCAEFVTREGRDGHAAKPFCSGESEVAWRYSLAMQTRMVEVRQRVLKQNDVTARALRDRFRQAGVFVVSLVSSPGAGKTAFLQELLTRLISNHRVAAIVGDLATDNDAVRLARSGAPVRQIVTGTVCHLEADMVEKSLAGWSLEQLDFLFIENVGNLVCPASYDLGEELRVVLFSVTEGEDKPLKYPTIFNTADVAVITKMDLAVAVEFNGSEARQSIDSVRPHMPVYELSTKTGFQVDRWVDYLEQRLSEYRSTLSQASQAAAPIVS